MAAEPVGFFSEDQVSSLTGLSKRQLRYWDDEHGFFSPEYVVDGNHVYSFRDLVGLRTIAPIRKKLSLQQLRRIDEELHKEHDSPWSTLKFYLAGKELLYRKDERLVSATKRGEEVFEIDVQAVAALTIRDLAKLRERGKGELGAVTRKRNVMGGTPVVAGTRIPTSLIWSYHEAGFSIEKILSGFPRLTRKDVEKAIEYEQEKRKKRAS